MMTIVGQEKTKILQNSVYVFNYVFFFTFKIVAFLLFTNIY